MRRTCTSVLLLSLCALVLTPVAGAAAPARFRAAGAVEAGRGLAPLWDGLLLQLSGLGRLWGGMGNRAELHGLGVASPGSVAEKIGCKADPNGLCLPDAASAGPNSEIGCSADPNGLCGPR